MVSKLVYYYSYSTGFDAHAQEEVASLLAPRNASSPSPLALNPHLRPSSGGLDDYILTMALLTVAILLLGGLARATGRRLRLDHCRAGGAGGADRERTQGRL